MRFYPVIGELTIKRVDQIHGVEVPGRGGLYEQEDVPSNRSCRSRRFSLIREVFSKTIMVRGLRIPAMSLHVDENGKSSAMNPREDVVTKPSKSSCTNDHKEPHRC